MSRIDQEGPLLRFFAPTRHPFGICLSLSRPRPAGPAQLCTLTHHTARTRPGPDGSHSPWHTRPRAPRSRSGPARRGPLTPSLSHPRAARTDMTESYPLGHWLSRSSSRHRSAPLSLAPASACSNPHGGRDARQPMTHTLSQHANASFRHYSAKRARESTQE